MRGIILSSICVHSMSLVDVKNGLTMRNTLVPSLIKRGKFGFCPTILFSGICSHISLHAACTYKCPQDRVSVNYSILPFFKILTWSMLNWSLSAFSGEKKQKAVFKGLLKGPRPFLFHLLLIMNIFAQPFFTKTTFYPHSTWLPTFWKIATVRNSLCFQTASILALLSAFLSPTKCYSLEFQSDHSLTYLDVQNQSVLTSRIVFKTWKLPKCEDEWKYEYVALQPVMEVITGKAKKPWWDYWSLWKAHQTS